MIPGKAGNIIASVVLVGIIMRSRITLSSHNCSSLQYFMPFRRKRMASMNLSVIASRQEQTLTLFAPTSRASGTQNKPLPDSCGAVLYKGRESPAAL